MTDQTKTTILLGALLLLASCASDPSIKSFDQAHACTDNGGKLAVENFDDLSPTSPPVYLGCEHE